MVTTRGAPRAGCTRPGLKPILHTSPPLPGLAPPPHLRARTKGEEHLQPACRMIETPPRLALGRGLHAYAHNTPLHRAPNAGTEGQRATTRLLSTPLHRAPNSGTEGPRGITRHQAGRGTTTVTSPPFYLCLFSADFGATSSPQATGRGPTIIGKPGQRASAGGWTPLDTASLGHIATSQRPRQHGRQSTNAKRHHGGTTSRLPKLGSGPRHAPQRPHKTQPVLHCCTSHGQHTREQHPTSGIPAGA